MPKIYIGIDPGVHTGIAVWNVATQSFTALKSANIVAAMEYVRSLDRGSLTLVIEDSNIRVHGNPAFMRKESLQGAGSVKRDGKIWREFAEHFGYTAMYISQLQKGKKWDAATFKAITKEPKGYNPHIRDAAKLVFGRK
jgi:hypothetical protein